MGAEQVMSNLGSLQPELKAIVSGQKVTIDWSWQGHAETVDMIEIHVDRNDGKGFVFLANDTTPGYTDTAPWPTNLIKWKYKAIYHRGDQSVGQWSLDLPVTVGG